MELILGILGLAVLAVLIYCAVTGTELPPTLKLILLVAVAIILLLCVLQAAGCSVPIVSPH